MTLGNILESAAVKHLAFPEQKGDLDYTESEKDGRFCINFSSAKSPEAAIECSVPFTGSDEEKNYLRLYFLSMVYNAAIHGMKRLKHKKSKK